MLELAQISLENIIKMLGRKWKLGNSVFVLVKRILMQVKTRNSIVLFTCF